MIVENFLSAVAPQGERPVKAADGESGEGSFSSLLEDSLIAEQAPPVADEDSALPDAEEGASLSGDDLSEQSVMVSMEEVTKNFGLTEKQVSRLAELLGISVDDMGRMEITAKNPGRNFPALMPDGAQKNLAELLNLVENGQLLGRQEDVSKIADMLGISKTAATALLEELGIFSFKIIGETATAPKSATSQTAQSETAPTAQGKTENSIQPSGQNNSQSSNNNNNAEGETLLPEGVNETDGDFMKNVDSNLKNALNQSPQTTDSERTATTLADGGVLKGSAVSKVFQPFTPSIGMEEANRGKQAKAVMNQIVEKASIISFPNRTRARISLSPPSLGFVNIEVSVRNEGASALIVVESQAVKQIIEQNIHQLRTAFDQQGIKVEAMSVSVAEQGENYSDGGARFGEARSDFADYAEGDETDEENPEDDAMANERMRKKAGSYYVLDIKV